jgi:hypothetical protein
VEKQSHNKSDSVAFKLETREEESQLNFKQKVLADAHQSLLNTLQTLEELKSHKANSLMIPFAHLGQGKYFGELALEKVCKEKNQQQKRRAATI